MEPDKNNEEQAVTITFGMKSPISIKGNWRGTHYSEVLKELSPKAGWALLEAYRQINEHPDNVERNAKYADILDERYDGVFYKITSCRDNWREPHHNLVIFENLDEDVAHELFNLELIVNKRGRGGYYSCAGFVQDWERISLESSYLIVANWSECIKLDGDGCFRIKFDDEGLINA